MQLGTDEQKATATAWLRMIYLANAAEPYDARAYDMAEAGFYATAPLAWPDVPLSVLREIAVDNCDLGGMEYGVRHWREAMRRVGARALWCPDDAKVDPSDVGAWWDSTMPY